MLWVLIRISSPQHMSQLMRLWYLSNRWPAKAQASLHNSAVSPEPSLFANIWYGSRWSPTKNQTSSPTGWLCMCVWRMSLRRTKSTIISWDGSYVVTENYRKLFLNYLQIPSLSSTDVLSYFSFLPSINVRFHWSFSAICRDWVKDGTATGP